MKLILCRRLNGKCPLAFTKIKSSGTILLRQESRSPRSTKPRIAQACPGTASVPCGEAASVASACQAKPAKP